MLRLKKIFIWQLAYTSNFGIDCRNILRVYSISILPGTNKYSLS